MEVRVLRLRPGDDLKQELLRYADVHEIRAGVILTCVGSLCDVNLRLADGKRTKTIRGRAFEIVSFVGTLTKQGGAHFHMAVADEHGRVALGGHVLQGCKVNTTAEIAILVCDAQLEFKREFDHQTGYKELQVHLRKGRHQTKL